MIWEEVKFERPIDFVRPAEYNFSIARQVGVGSLVRGLLMTYCVGGSGQLRVFMMRLWRYIKEI